MSQDRTAARKQLRRIPDNQRKRSSQSCDLCRNKRRKCVRAPSGDACVACKTQKVSCSYVLPRKTRFYGSLDDLSDRYKCLEAVVRGAFPDEPIGTAAELMQLGRRKGYEMPDLSRGSGNTARLEDLVNTPPPSEPPELTASISSSNPPWNHDTVEDIAPREEGQGLPAPTADDEHFSLIRDTAGREHYIGPSGSLQFLCQLRCLLRRQENDDIGIVPTPASRFTQDDTAQALETDGNVEELDDTIHERPVPTGHQDNLSPGSINSSIAKDFTSPQQPNGAEQLLAQLPPQIQVEQLLQSFFRHVHEDFPLFHRATFQEEYESYILRPHGVRSRREAPVHSGPDPGWIGCLHMMLVFGSVSDPRIPSLDHTALRRHCVSATRNMLPQLLSKCLLDNARALLLLGLFLHNNNERNAAWNLVGAAARICFALGLHRTGAGATLRPIEREARKRVFCTLYSFDQLLASSLGRPSGLSDPDVQVVPPREELLGGCHDGDDDGLLPLSLGLQKILAKARLSPGLAMTSGTAYEANRHRNSAEEILSSLKKWKLDVAKYQGLDLPSITEAQDPVSLTDNPSMGFDELKTMLGWQSRPRLRAALLLHMQYHYVAILVTRPFLLRSVASSKTTEAHRALECDPLSEACVRHACQLGRIVLLLDGFHLVNGVSGLDVFYAYSAAMVLILRALGRPDAFNASIEADNGTTDQEPGLLELLRDLTARLKEMVLRVSKSRTMRRFARVTALFMESVYANRTGIRVPVPNGSYSGTIPRNVDPLIDPRLQTPAAASMHPMIGPNGHPTGYDAQSHMWAAGGTVTFEDAADFNSWIGPFIGAGPDATTMDWEDIGNLLGT